MPIQLQNLSEEQLAQIFGRRPRGQEDVEDYIQILEAQKMAIGKGFALKTVKVKPEEGDEYTILDGSVDEEDPMGITVRAAKRRFNLAGKELGFKIIWREPDGWLSGKAVELPPDEENGETAS